MDSKETAYAGDEQISENLAVTIYANHLNLQISADSEPGNKPAAPDAKPRTTAASATGTTRVRRAKTVESILKEAGPRGIHGGLRLENPRFEGGKACVDIHAWAKIEIFGHKVAFDERFSHCVEPGRRMTVWNNGWAHIEICFRPPKQIYATLYISKLGFERHWNDCVDLPGPTAS